MGLRSLVGQFGIHSSCCFSGPATKGTAQVEGTSTVATSEIATLSASSASGTGELPSSASSSDPLNPSSQTKKDANAVYITNYITQYVGVPGPAGRDGTNGKDGRDGYYLNTGAEQIVPSYSGYIYSPSGSSLGVSTISYLKDTTIDNPTMQNGTALNLSLTTPKIQDPSFNGVANFNNSAIFSDTANANALIAASSTLLNAVLTNSTTTNAYIAYLTAGMFSVNGDLGVYGTSTLATTTISSLTVGDATTTNLFATSSNFISATTTNFFTQNLSVGDASVQGNQSVTGTFAVTGTSTLGANVSLNGNVVVGTSSNELLTINALVNSNFVPAQNKIYDIGSPSFYWKGVYADTINVNTLAAASTTISGTSNNIFTINSDNGSTDSEDSTLVFFRGLVTPNALLRWNATTKRLESNMSLKIQNETPSTGTTTFTVQAGAGQGATNLFELVNNAGTKLSVFDPNGWLGIGTTTPGSALSVVGNAYFGGNVTATGTLTILGQTALAAASSTGLSVTGGAYLATTGGNVGIGTTTPASKLSVAGDINFTGNLYQNGTLFGTLSGGTNGYLARWTGASTLSKGLLLDSGTYAGVNATSSSYTFNVQGSSGVNPFNVASSTGASLLTVLQNGNVGIGTTTPGQTFAIQGTGAIDPFLISSSTGATMFSVTSNGHVGIGTSNASTKLYVTDTIDSAQFSIAYDATRYSSMQVDASGNMSMTSSNGNIMIPNDNLKVCQGGACPTTTATSSAGNLFVENAVTIGDGFSVRELSPTELGLYNASGTVMVIFDNGI